MKIEELLEGIDPTLLEKNRKGNKRKARKRRRWKASRKVCAQNTPTDELGASTASSCIAQGLRPHRDSEVKMTIRGKRSKLGSKVVKSEIYGGPAKNYSK